MVDDVWSWCMLTKRVNCLVNLTCMILDCLFASLGSPEFCGHDACWPRESVFLWIWYAWSLIACLQFWGHMSEFLSLLFCCWLLCSNLFYFLYLWCLLSVHANKRKKINDAVSCYQDVGSNCTWHPDQKMNYRYIHRSNLLPYRVAIQEITIPSCLFSTNMLTWGLLVPLFIVGHRLFLLYFPFLSFCALMWTKCFSSAITNYIKAFYFRV